MVCISPFNRSHSSCKGRLESKSPFRMGFKHEPWKTFGVQISEAGDIIEEHILHWRNVFQEICYSSYLFSDEDRDWSGLDLRTTGQIPSLLSLGYKLVFKPIRSK